ncbi:MAG: hypothetical protein M3Q10_02040 [Chloroflexota bacterium]|nr:hypothetical protein [Chloroflexota bacterium]
MRDRGRRGRLGLSAGGDKTRGPEAAPSYDPRTGDGSEAVRFPVWIKELVEDPETPLLEG